MNYNTMFRNAERHSEYYRNNDRPNIVTFNVGGTIFQTLHSTIVFSDNMVPPLMDAKFMLKHWDEDRQEYFFDRDPQPFRIILNYMRYGALHVPPRMCSMKIISELTFWGINANLIEPCCWLNFDADIEFLQTLTWLEKGLKPTYLQEVKQENLSRFQIAKRKVFHFLYISRVFMILSFIVVILRELVYCMHDSSYHKDLHEFLLGSTLTNNPSLFNETFREYGEIYHNTLEIIEYFCLAFLALESLALFLSAPSKMKLLSDYLVCLDLCLVILDFVILLDPIAYHETYYKFIRLFRLLRLIRRAKGTWVVSYTFMYSLKELVVVAYLHYVAVFTFATLMYLFGNDKYIDSIPNGCWWSIQTLATVGYGDVLPMTIEGKIIGCFCGITGGLLLGIAIPTLIRNFLSIYFNMKYIEFKESVTMGRMQENRSKRDSKSSFELN